VSCVDVGPREVLSESQRCSRVSDRYDSKWQSSREAFVRVDVDAACSCCVTGGCTINNEMGDCGEMHPGS
jgi:hypothetical protein